MNDIASEFINEKILKKVEKSNTRKFLEWQVFFYKRFLSHKRELKMFSDGYKPSQGQIDFARSISIYNILKEFNGAFYENFPRKYKLKINENIKKFPRFQRTSYIYNDNVRFEPILNLGLLKLTLGFAESILHSLNEFDCKHKITVKVSKIIKSEIDLIKKRITNIESDMNVIPKNFVKNGNNFDRKRSIANPKVSIITTSYNLKNFVKDTMNSICNLEKCSFEHIVIDGKSKDGSVGLIKSYPNTICVSEKDSGYPDAFWKGLKMSRGKYITQCSISDGYASKKWIKKCIKILDENKDVSLVWGLPQYLTEDSKRGPVSYPQFYYNDAPQKQEMFNYWLKSGFFYPEGNLCVRKSVILKCYPSLEDCKRGVNDWLEFSYRFNKLGYVSMHLPLVANFGRTHGNQLGQRMSISGEMKKGRNAYLNKVTLYKIMLLLGLSKHHFINSDGKKINMKFNKKIFVTKDIFRNLFTIDDQYLDLKTYIDFIKRKITV